MSQHLSETISRQGELAPVNPPLLENGDHLTRCEFERRYQARPDIKKVELIEGVVYLSSPVRAKSHGEPHGRIMAWLGTYYALTPGVDLADNATVRLDLDNESQPDALLRVEPSVGGHSHISEDDYIEGAPELIIEIAASSALYDLHEKLRVYRRNGVQEYIVWRVLDKQIDWYRLVDGEYVPQVSDETGLIHSQVFPGLCLAVQSLLDGNLAKVLTELQKGLGIPKHLAFVERLQKK
jgi:Uma2 family endonuclease